MLSVKNNLMVPTVAAIVAALGTVLPACAQSANADDEKAIRDGVKAYARAFAASDATALANMWTSDGSFTDSDGKDHNGRAAIERYFRGLLGQKNGQTLDINIESIKFPAANVAIEEGTTRITSGPGMGGTGHYVVVHTKNGGTWQMQTAAETNSNSGSSSDYLKDLNWLVGNWSIKGQPQAAHLRVTWSKGQTFLVCQYLGTDKSTPLEELQIIGWDPESRSIVTWHFGASGGYGSGQMAFDGKSWVESARATEPNGITGSARYRLTKVDGDNFTWQSSSRIRDGKRLPDSTALTITRDTSTLQ